MSSEHLFACAGIDLSFGGVRVLNGVSLHVDAGEIVGIIGPNGAGKTTLLNSISGFVAPDAGQATLDGRDLGGLLPYERAELGLGRTFQQALMFPSLTVLENLLIASHRHSHHGLFSHTLRRADAVRAERAAVERVEHTMDVIDLSPYLGAKAGALSFGTLRMLELACLLVQTPKFLLLDEPASGIAQREAEALAPLLKRVREETGTTMLMIEHDIPLISGLSDRMYAMDLGRVIAEGPPREVLAHPEVIASYLGEQEEAAPAQKPKSRSARAARSSAQTAGGASR
ncbi:MAG: ABC transporter ATP-binding protein [Actinomycetota bacterium]